MMANQADICRSQAVATRKETRVPTDQTSAQTPAAKAVPPTDSAAPLLPEEAAAELRRLAHDLSNSLEVIVQTSYLMSLAELKEPAAEWLRMLEVGVSKALEINGAIRNYVREHSPK